MKKLPIKPPFPSMEAKSVEKIPIGDEWQYEPKWDGFRCIAFRNGDDVQLQSKSGQPLARYFPEIVAAVKAIKAKQFVLDGEIVVPIDGELSFDELLQRIHPAESRVKKLAAAHPGIFIVFDLLVDEGAHSLVEKSLKLRRPQLEKFATKHLKRTGQVRLSPATADIKIAREWFRLSGGALDGIIAKRLDMEYRSGDRTGMVKIKNMRTAECVVAGYRYGSKATKTLGSLLLGLYGDDGLLHHVGFTSSFTESERKDLTKKLDKLRKSTDKGGGFSGKSPGGPSRWSTERSGEWEAVAPKLVAEVQFDHFTGGRFRHGTKFLRWRPDKAARSCKMDQVVTGGSSLKVLESAKNARSKLRG